MPFNFKPLQGIYGAFRGKTSSYELENFIRRDDKGLFAEKNLDDLVTP
jgi:hypothetical protein